MSVPSFICSISRRPVRRSYHRVSIIVNVHRRTTRWIALRVTVPQKIAAPLLCLAQSLRPLPSRVASSPWITLNVLCSHGEILFTRRLDTRRWLYVFFRDQFPARKESLFIASVDEDASLFDEAALCRFANAIYYSCLPGNFIKRSTDNYSYTDTRGQLRIIRIYGRFGITRWRLIVFFWVLTILQFVQHLIISIRCRS